MVVQMSPFCYVLGGIDCSRLGSCVVVPLWCHLRKRQLYVATACLYEVAAVCAAGCVDVP